MGCDVAKERGRMRAFWGWHRMCDRVLDAQEIGG